MKRTDNLRRNLQNVRNLVSIYGSIILIDLTVAAERPRLKLQPRTKSTEAASEISRPSSIFGEAKPVDTAAKEREIEEKIVREREQQVLSLSFFFRFCGN